MAKLAELRTRCTTNEEDARERFIRAIVRRRGQPEFRNRLLIAYERKCAVTRFDAVQALEAAHIIKYKGPQTNHITNGLLLRADLHVLFDLRLWGIDTATMRVIIAPELKGTNYAIWTDTPLFLPKDPQDRPNIDALNIHRNQFEL